MRAAAPPRGRLRERRGATGWRGRPAPVKGDGDAAARKGLDRLVVLDGGGGRTDEQLFLDLGARVADGLFDLVGDVAVGLQELAGIVAALADALAVEREPGA